MGFSRQKYWNGLPFPSLGDLPDPGIEPTSPELSGRFFAKGWYMVYYFAPPQACMMKSSWQSLSPMVQKLALPYLSRWVPNLFGQESPFWITPICILQTCIPRYSLMKTMLPPCSNAAHTLTPVLGDGGFLPRFPFSRLARPSVLPSPHHPLLSFLPV